MANTMDKLRELSASLKADAAALRRDGVYGCCAGTYEYAAAHIDAILRESEAQGDAGAVEAWERRLRGRAGPFTAQAGERYVDADVALEAFRFALAASAERAETAEGRESECPWGGCGDCVGHEVIQSAGDGFPPDLHPRTADLVRRFAVALAEKLAAAEKKYGYSDGWADAGWMDECRQKLVEHIAKGDPRDVAAYCAFLWHHNESTAGAKQPAAVDGACAAAAIRFALTDPEGMTFLRLWNEGEFDTLRREWPDAPSEVYVGADPLATQHQEPPHDRRD